MPRINWDVIAVTEAVFRAYEDDGEELSVYIYGQDWPIKCTSGHRITCIEALRVCESLIDGDSIQYYTKGGDTAGWTQRYFVKIKLLSKKEQTSGKAQQYQQSEDKFKVGATIEHTLWGSGEIEEVVKKGKTIHLKIIFHNTGQKQHIQLNTSTMRVTNNKEDY